MSATCVICSDSLDGRSEIVATPCGHVYHATCLTTWVNQSKSCPQCRSRTYLRGILKLFFNFIPQSQTNAPDLENEILVLTSRLNAKESELRTCEQERDDHIANVCDAEENASDLFEAFSTLQHEVSQLRLKVQSLDAKVFELEQINAVLSNDLEQYRDIQAIVSGTQKDVQDILREHSSHTNSAEQLATYCACLKRKLLEAVCHRNKLIQSNSKIQYENSVYAEKLKFYEDAMGVPKSEFKAKTSAPAKPASPLVPLNFLSATACANKDYVEEICISPVSVAFNRNEFNLYIKAPNGAGTSASKCQTNFQFANTSSGGKRKDNSVIGIKYNALDSRGKMTASSGFKKIKITKPA